MKGCGVGSFVNAFPVKNCQFQTVEFGEKLVVVVVATKNIVTGTELSIAYNCTIIKRDDKITNKHEHVKADVTASNVNSLLINETK